MMLFLYLTCISHNPFLTPIRSSPLLLYSLFKCVFSLSLASQSYIRLAKIIKIKVARFSANRPAQEKIITRFSGPHGPSTPSKRRKYVCMYVCTRPLAYHNSKNPRMQMWEHGWPHFHVHMLINPLACFTEVHYWSETKLCGFLRAPELHSAYATLCWSLSRFKISRDRPYS